MLTGKIGKIGRRRRHLKHTRQSTLPTAAWQPCIQLVRKYPIHEPLIEPACQRRFDPTTVPHRWPTLPTLSSNRVGCVWVVRPGSVGCRFLRPASARNRFMTRMLKRKTTNHHRPTRISGQIPALNMAEGEPSAKTANLALAA